MSTVDLTVDEEQLAPPKDLPSQASNDNVSSGPSPRPVTLPVSRIKTIMKSCPDTSMVSQEAAMLVTKSTVSHCGIHIAICSNMSMRCVGALSCGGCTIGV